MSRSKESAFSDMKVMIKNAVKELFEDEEFLTKVAEKVSTKIDKEIQLLHEKINGLEKHNKELTSKINEFDQYSRRKNLRLFNIEENQEEDTCKTIMKIMKDKLKINIKEQEIEACYRVGPKIRNKTRPVFIKFCNYNTRQLILQNRKLLKGTKMSIMEDLTKSNLQLLKTSLDILGRGNAWSHNGKVMTKINNKIIEIQDETNCLLLAGKINK